MSPEPLLPGTRRTPPAQTYIADNGTARAGLSVANRRIGGASDLGRNQNLPRHPQSRPRVFFGRALLGPLTLALPSTLSCATETVLLTEDANTLSVSSQTGSPPNPTLAPDEVIQPNDQIISPEPDAATDPARCTKIDLLYIIDNSESMREEQDNLIRSFPAFVDVVQSVLGNSDYQIMVVDTDATGLPSFASLDDLLEGNLSCDPQPSCCGDACVLASIPFVDAFVSSCNGTPCANLLLANTGAESCEGVLGAGRRLALSGEQCGIVDSRRYMRADQPNLSETFSCAAQVGTAGNGREQPMGALLAALSAYHNDVGGCNAGFLREDAVLVITFITDEEDSESPGGPDQWREAVLNVKGGNDASVVVLGLVGDENLIAGAGGAANTEMTQRLREFVQSFRFGSLGSVRSEDYTPFFEAAVTGIETSCREFMSAR